MIGPRRSDDAGAGSAFERTAARIALTGRILGTITVVLNAASSRATFRRKWAMHLTSAALVANTVAATRRQFRSAQIIDDINARTDLAAGIAVLFGEAMARVDRFRYPGARPGTDYAAIAAALVSTEYADPGARRRALALLLGTIWATTSGGRPDGTGPSVTHLVTDVTGVGGSASLANWTVGVLRNSVAAVREAHDLVVVETIRLEQLRERDRHHRLLHDSVLQVFEAIAADLNLDTASTIALLDQEVARLIGSLSGESRTAITDGVDELRSFARALELDLTFVEHSHADPPPYAIDALIDAAREALTNIRKYARVREVMLTVRQRDQGLELTIADLGTGFDPTATRLGFGVDHSIRDRLHAIGGIGEVESVPGHGTRVTLWAPY